MNLARGKYRGFNDSHLAEKVRDEESLPVSRETVRRILSGAKLRLPRIAGRENAAPRHFRSLPRRFDLARCLSSRYQRVVAADYTVTLGARSIVGHRGYAGETVELSHQLDGTLRVYRGDSLLLDPSLPLQERADRRPAPLATAQKRKTPVPRIYNLSGRPALAAVT